jgi:hypothetical protein
MLKLEHSIKATYMILRHIVGKAQIRDMTVPRGMCDEQICAETGLP